MRAQRKSGGVDGEDCVRHILALSANATIIGTTTDISLSSGKSQLSVFRLVFCVRKLL
jgi:hypothetical protein